METNSTENYASFKTILVVEDEEMIRKVCEAVLRKSGFASILAGNGAEGLAIYRERHREICLVLADVSMPVMNGLDMFRDMLEFQPHVNVILMSGYSTAEIVPAQLRKFCSVMEKPFTAAALMESVNKCLNYGNQKKSEKQGA